MEQWTKILNFIDLLVKTTVAVAAVLLFGLESQRLGVEKDRLGVERERLSVEKDRLTNLQLQQTTNIAVAEKIIALLFEEKNKCIAEDQAFLIDFLIDNNNAYNRIQINKQDFLRASAARRNCSGGAVGRDSRDTVAVNAGTVPVVTTGQADELKNQLTARGVHVASVENVPESPSGYVAVGAYSSSNRAFRNFQVPAADIVGDNGEIRSGAQIVPLWAVYLRANTSNTEGGGNAILGVVDERSCLKVLKSFPDVRGQTWAAVKLVNCA